MNGVERLVVNGSNYPQTNGHIPANGANDGAVDRLQIIDDQKTFTLVHCCYSYCIC